MIEKQRNEIKKLDQSVLDYKTENEEVSTLSEGPIDLCGSVYVEPIYTLFYELLASHKFTPKFRTTIQ